MDSIYLDKDGSFKPRFRTFGKYHKDFRWEVFFHALVWYYASAGIVYLAGAFTDINTESNSYQTFYR